MPTTTGWYYPLSGKTTVASVADQPWSNLNNLGAADGSNASAALGPGEASDIIDVSFNNAGDTASQLAADVPSTATLNGFELEIRKQQGVGEDTVDDNMRFRSSSGVLGNVILNTGSQAGAWGTLGAAVTDLFGSSSNALGLTTANIRAAGFRLRFGVIENTGLAAAAPLCDYVRVRATYTDVITLSSPVIGADGKSVTITSNKTLSSIGSIGASDITIQANTNSPSVVLARTFNVIPASVAINGTTITASFDPGTHGAFMVGEAVTCTVAASKFTASDGSLNSALSAAAATNNSTLPLTIYASSAVTDGAAQTGSSLANAAQFLSAAAGVRNIKSIINAMKQTSGIKTAYCTGSFLAQTVTLGQDADPGGPTDWYIYVDVTLPTVVVSSFGAPTGGRTKAYELALAAEPGCVTLNWTYTDERPKGHLARAATYTAAGCEAQAGSFAWVAGTLYVHPYGDADPNAEIAGGSVYRYHIKGDDYGGDKIGFNIIRGTRCYVTIQNSSGWTNHDVAGGGYCARLTDCIDSYIYVVKGRDGKNHVVGINGNTISNGNWYGPCNVGGVKDGNMAVVYKSGGDYTEGRASEAMIAHGYTLLKPDGTALEANKDCGGFFAHGSTAGNNIDLQTFRSCIYQGYAGFSGAAFAGGDGVSPPGDPEDPTTYALQYIDCDCLNGDVNNVSNNVAYSMDRCYLDLRRRKDTSTAGGDSCIRIASSAGRATYACFRSCVIFGDIQGIASAGMITATAIDGSEINFKNTTLYANGAGSAEPIVRIGQAGAHARFEQCIMARETSGALFVVTGGANEADILVARNAYFNIAATVWTNSAASNTQAEYALLDPVVDGAYYGSGAPGFISAPTDLGLTPSASARVNKLPVTATGPIGINGVGFHFNYGANQYLDSLMRGRASSGGGARTGSLRFRP